MVFALVHFVLDSLWHFPSFIDWVILKESSLWIPVVFTMTPCCLLFITVVVIVSSSNRHWNIDMLGGISDWFIVDVSVGNLNWLVINVSQCVLNWFEFSMSSEVGMAIFWVIMMRTFVMVVSDVGIQRGHYCLMVLGSVLVVISMVVEFDMWCNNLTSMNEMFMMMMINWMGNFLMDDLMMVVWGFVMDIVVNFVDMVGLMMVVMIIMVMVYDLMVYGGNMMDVNIMMIKIVMIVEAMIRVDIMVYNVTMASISEVIKLVRVMLPLSLMTEPFHIFMMSVMMVISMVTIIHILHIVLMILTMHVMTMHCMGWSMHIMNWSWVMDWMSEFVPIVWIVSK